MRAIVLAALTAVGFAHAGADAAAQVYPSRPVSIVAPFPAGGAADTLARTMAERMRPTLGQPIIVENVSGASGSLGAGRVARAAPDGHTLILGNVATHVINGAAFKLKYDVRSDFEPIALIASQPMTIVSKKTMPAENLLELIAWLKANPDKALVATSGPGSMPHIVGLLFQKDVGVRFRFVPYRGLVSAIQDLVAGQLDLMFDVDPNALAQVRAGTVRAHAVMARDRLAAMPDIPTVDEAGLPGFHASTWYSLWAPRGTPKAVIATLNTAVVNALEGSAIRSELANIGQHVYPREQLTPEALAAIHRTEIDRWWPIVKAAAADNPAD
jgi:tripartite-type tricarboxylate transporter receptor subunit TctC